MLTIETNFIKGVRLNPLMGKNRDYPKGKIPSDWLVFCDDNKFRRVYICQYGNAGSLFIIKDGKDHYLGVSDFSDFPRI